MDGINGTALVITTPLISLPLKAHDRDNFLEYGMELPPCSAAEPQTGREQARQPQTCCEAPKRLAERNAETISRAPKTEAVSRRLLRRRLKRTVSSPLDAVCGS
ncbi:hypothetical protein NDU88_002136 [Pleurodeles waltl]|uniref:Uncharacterized protein n=1 Tax=Pleurodeles waltl TaxID=8319 RepID=A0AAV7P5V1_PLEWA|nr:hypothetical protein NDU88_002136 [Pleurodeles waltl]